MDNEMVDRFSGSDHSAPNPSQEVLLPSGYVGSVTITAARQRRNLTGLP